MAIVIGAVMVGLWSLTREVPDRFPQAASLSTAPASASSNQQMDYGQWKARFDQVFVHTRWYSAISQTFATTDDTLIIRTTLTPGSVGAALALGACRAAEDAEEEASVRFDGGILVFGVRGDTPVPLAASTVGGCYA
jgi:hypothetical protein